MKPIILTLLATLALSASAQAKSITVATTDGDVDIAVSEIKDLVFGDDGRLDINLTNQSIRSFSADKFKAIRFDNMNSNSAVKNVISDSDDSADIFSISGVQVARGARLADVKANLQPGVYIVKSANGSTSKILVK
jgi:spermidine/putrescine-binding protein